MPQGNDQERTEQATPKKREDARKKGQVAQSREISSALVLLSSLGVFFFAGSWMILQLSEIMRTSLSAMGTLQLRDFSLYTFAVTLGKQFVVVLAPLMAAVFVAGIAGNLMQFGFLFTAEPLVPKLSKMNPLNGLKRIFSMRALAELVKCLVKILFIGLIAILLMQRELAGIQTLMYADTGGILAFIGRAAFRIGGYSCLALVGLAGLDYAFQRWQHEKTLKMTKQEVLEETKQREGDPKIKARIRAVQMEMARHRMMEKVPFADVVITNPTRLAIALSFDNRTMDAPRVVAKGAGFIARRIRELARENDVPVVEQKSLARMLFKAADIGDYIPVELYRAVAEILAYVYRLRGSAGMTG